MTVPHHTFGSTTIAKVHSNSELRQIFNDPWLHAKTIVVKPNWVSTEPADFTDAKALRSLFEALDARFVVVESYCLARALNLRPTGVPFTASGQEVNWQWLLKGAGWQWLVEHPDWAWFQEGGHREQLRAEEQAFLDTHGFADLFAEFDVTYVNVTEEVWRGRTADPTAVQDIVEARFPPAHTAQLYGMVPQSLFDLRGTTFISYARLKMYASFTLKNLFGLIPDPLRPWWHGPQNCRLAQSIVDINKVYHALFNVYGICEALHTMGFSDPNGEFEGIYSGKYSIVEDFGVVAFGRDLVALDSLLLHLSDPATRQIAGINREPIELAATMLGAYDQAAIAAAKRAAGDWLSPLPARALLPNRPA